MRRRCDARARRSWLQAEYEAWRDQLPESLAESRTAGLLEDSARITVETADIDPAFFADLVFQRLLLAEDPPGRGDKSPDFLLLEATLSPGLVSRFRTTIPKAAHQLTGRPYTGRIEAGDRPD